MSTPVRASDRDLRALAAIVSEDRSDLPDGEGLPPSLLADLMAQIRCDEISLECHDSRRWETRFLQIIPVALAEDIGAAEDSQRTGSITGTASLAVIPTAPATCAVS